MTPDLAAAVSMFREHGDSVLFVTSQLRARELKMAHGLRRLGWKVGVIYFHWTPFDHAGHFDFGIPVASVEEARGAATALSPRVCHVFSGAIDDLVLRFCRSKPCPVVIDLNDVFAPSLFDYCHDRFEPTREALELADGFCARDLQAVWAKRNDGFRLPPRVILYPEYCWNDRPVPDPAGARPPSDEIHVVSVGTFSLETQGMYDSGYLQLVRMFVDQGIHFHIYPHWSYRRDHDGSPHADYARDFADYLALERTTPFVHLHESLPLDALRCELPRYDFGIVSGGCREFGQRLKYYRPAYVRTCYSGRIADYLDAHLPVLVNDEVKFDFDLLRHYGACVDLKGLLAPGFKAMLLRKMRDPERPAVMDRAARLLSIDHNAPRLGAFYRALMSEHAPVQISATPPADSVRGDIPALPESGTHDTEHAPVAARDGWGEALRRGVRWLSPRLAKIVLPYRAIRMFEVRLHNSLQESERGRAAIASLRADLEAMARERVAAEETQRRLEGAAGQAAAELQTVRESLSRSERTTAELQDELARWHLRGEAFERYRASLESRLDQAQRDAGLAEQRILELGRSLSAAECQAGVGKAEAAGLERALAAAQDRAVRAEQDRAAVDAHARSVVEMSDRLREQIDQADRIAAGLRKAHDDADRERVRLAHELAEARVAREAARHEADALRSARDEALRRADELEQRRAETQSRTEAAEAALRSWTGRSERERLTPAAAEIAEVVHRVTHQPDGRFVVLDDAPKLLLACMPKSGSTWLTQVLGDALGMPSVRGYLEADRNEQELDVAALFRTWGQRTFFVQQHVRYSRMTLGLCRAFSTKIVVLTRRLDDIVVSLRDHVERESPECSMFYTETDWFADRTPVEQLDFIIDHAVPWYLNFYVGWMRAVARYPEQTLHVTYESLIENSAACVDRIARFHGEPALRSATEDLDRRVGTRFNQGRVGRGREILSEHQQDRLRALAQYYAGAVDLGAVGL